MTASTASKKGDGQGMFAAGAVKRQTLKPALAEDVSGMRIIKLARA